MSSSLSLPPAKFCSAPTIAADGEGLLSNATNFATAPEDCKCKFPMRECAKKCQKRTLPRGKWGVQKALYKAEKVNSA
jgi:hypothetical protein